MLARSAVTQIGAVALLFALIALIAFVGFTSLSTTGGETSQPSSLEPFMLVGVIAVGIVGYLASRRKGR